MATTIINSISVKPEREHSLGQFRLCIHRGFDRRGLVMAVIDYGK
jgi:hypothetical protein